MNYVVFDATGNDYRAVPALFSTIEEANAYCDKENARYASSNPWIVRKLVEVAAYDAAVALLLSKLETLASPPVAL